eukprot:SAG11_NODE_26221_length_348_cov_0.803213_1_plen_56_part_10
MAVRVRTKSTRAKILHTEILRENKKLPKNGNKQKFQHEHRKNDTGDYHSTKHLQNS